MTTHKPLSKTGLDARQAKELLTQYGPNEIRSVGHVSPLTILWRQIRGNFIVFLLLAAMVLSFAVGKSITAYTVLGVIAMVIIVGFVQEFRSERAIDALKNMLMPVSIVRRNGKEVEISSAEIVPGDILVLRTGEKVPADAVVIEEKELRVNESVLTGESRDVRKLAVADPANATHETQVFMGTYVVYGRCLASVVHTGMNTRFGQISQSISESTKDLPLQKKINRIGKYIATVAAVIALATGALMLFRTPVLTEEALINILILVIALAISAFPEGFPVVLISTLSAGAYRMAKKNAIVNRMSIIETLGETTVICTDKTGTITKGEMTVTSVWQNGIWIDVSGSGYEAEGDFRRDGKKIDIEKEEELRLLIQSSVLCNDTTIERTGEDSEYKIHGSATEAALMIMAAKAGVYKDDMAVERVEEIPFNSERKMMSVYCRSQEGNFVYSKGAPEMLLDHCLYLLTKKGKRKITQKDKDEMFKAQQQMAHQAMRVLAIAYKPAESFAKNHFEQDLVFLGLVGMEDAPREEVKEALEDCRRAGIVVKMITGDNRETATAVASQIGLGGKTLLGAELENMTDDELTRSISDIAIFARVKPEHKMRLVTALKNRGDIVTMTGDGVNDAPALKTAHIGIAMGKNGTDVSRSVADLTLKDDNFATIVSAIREGRTIFKNIRKFVSYQLSCNIAELTILFVGVLVAPWLGWIVPLLVALQILFMNLVTDNLPAITLGFNPSSPDLMNEKPRKNARILSKELLILTLGTGFLLALITLGVFYCTYNVLEFETARARTVALVTLIMLEIASAFNFRSYTKGVLRRSLFVNKYLVLASVLSIIATLVVVYTPANRVFETTPIGVFGWTVALIAFFLLWIVFDMWKLYNNKRGVLDFER